jgi:hypothetical protein
MGVDLNPIGFGISSGWSRTGFGTIVSYPSGASYPAYGTYNSTLYGTPYETGSTITVSAISYTDYNQICDVTVKNDGAGGTYTDWATATNVAYKNSVQYMGTSTDESHTASPVTIWGNNYNTASATGYAYYHNGSGGYRREDAGLNTIDPSLLYNDYINSSSTANYYLLYLFGSGYQKGKYTTFYANGVGTYGSSDDQGSYQNYGTYITSDPDMGNPYYWDGNGGYYMG